MLLALDGPTALSIPAFVVVGGGRDGAFYVRQLGRAVDAGRLTTRDVIVVDRNSGCEAALLATGRVRLDVASWSDWLDSHLDGLDPGAHLVPYHWAPHLLVDWLARQLALAGATVERGGPVPPRGLPMERDTRAGDRALSYASWICPVTCIEPELCPKTMGLKSWSLAGDLDRPRPDDPWDDRIVFACFHLLYGVGTIPVRAIIEARSRVLQGLPRGPRRYLVATSSHCHGLATTLSVRP